MTLDRDGKIRMDCSSPWAMASLIEQRDRFAVATGNDADADRHGIVTPDGGLMNPNHFLAVAIGYLFAHRPGWPAEAAVGKTLVSSGMIDRWSAGSAGGSTRCRSASSGSSTACSTAPSASAARRARAPRSCGATAASGPPTRTASSWRCSRPEITAATGRSPSEHYADLVREHGDPAYARVDAPADRHQKAKLAALTPDAVTATELAGEPITAKLTEAPGNGAAIGGLKVTTESAWFAARPSGTEDVYKIYAESFRGSDHLASVQDEARQVVSAALS
jgi:phosphoglucomutase